jgi:hypothetical protein
VPNGLLHAAPIYSGLEADDKGENFVIKRQSKDLDYQPGSAYFTTLMSFILSKKHCARIGEE